MVQGGTIQKQSTKRAPKKGLILHLYIMLTIQLLLSGGQ